MKTMHKLLGCSLLAFWFFGIGHSQNAIADDTASAEPLTVENYAKDGKTKGVVLFAIRWDRKWNCGGFENAQLRLIAFDKLPSRYKASDDKADLQLADAPLIMTKPEFDNYAYLVEPGEYALSRLHIKAARSITDVGVAKIERNALMKDGKAEGGTFTVQAGEIVYLGHFYLDCYGQPSLWRYYLQDKDTFNNYLAEWAKRFPEIDFSKAQFHLFKTKNFGQDFELK